MTVGHIEAMPRPFHSTYWETVLPDGWQARKCGGGDFVFIWHPEGVGQLHLLAGKGNGPPSRSATTFQPYFGSLSGHYREHKTSNCFSRLWILLCADQWLNARYTCWTGTYDWELAAVDTIVQSIAAIAQGE